MKSSLGKSYFCWFAVLLASGIASCAKVGSPTGGPKDVTPPLLTGSIPQMSATGFAGEEIIINFNEYIQLKDVYNEVLISPPLAERPVITARNRDVSVLFNESLLPNTTYTINFGGAIADINEGNPLKNFEFVFSTGNFIDTLSLTGTAFDAYDGKPPSKDQKVYIMLYENLKDSAPLLELPRYIGKVDETGSFAVNNIREGVYRTVVVKDTDGDMMYDPVSDAIGFADSLLSIEPAKTSKMTIVTDTSGTGTGEGPKTRTLHSVSTKIVFFNELPSRVFIDNKSRPEPERLFITFTRPPYDTVIITPVNFTPEGDWYYKESSASNDTVILWLTDSKLIDNEDLSLEITYTTVDSAGNFTTARDTASFVSRPAVTSVARRSGEPVEAVLPSAAISASKFSLSSNIEGGRQLDLNAPVKLMAKRPVASVIDSLFILEEIKDTLKLARDFTITADTFSRVLNLHSRWQSVARYSLTVLPGAVTDIYGVANDTVKLQFRTRNIEEYGNIVINAESDSFPIIIQLINDKGLVVKEASLAQPGPASFSYMVPGNYTLKAVHDSNNNGKWDTGNFLKKVRPEKVDFYDKPVSVRANWDYDISWQTAD